MDFLDDASTENFVSKPEFVQLKHPVSGETVRYAKAFGKQELLESALKYKPESSDIFLCSYQKCGSTWMQNITWLIVHGGEPMPKTTLAFEAIPMLEYRGREKVECIDNSEFPRIVKTHFPYHFTPQHPDVKYIYITRNPKDVLVSYFHHIKAMSVVYKCSNEFQLENLFELFIKGEVEFNDYFDHVNEWYAKRDQPNVLFLLYEDLKRDLRSNILKIARFLGSNYEKPLLEDNEKILQKIMETVNIKVMKKDERWGIPFSKEGKHPFIRKGEVGDWKNHLTPEQSSILDKMLEEKGRESGINKLWDDYPEVTAV